MIFAAVVVVLALIELVVGIMVARYIRDKFR